MTKNLLDLAEAGDVPGVLKELTTLTPEQRAEYGAVLAERRRDSSRWETALTPEEQAPILAELGCRVTPEATALLLLDLGDRLGSADPAMEIIDRQPVQWRTELVAFLDTHGGHPSYYGSSFRIADRIVRDTGCPPPTCQAFLLCWLSDRRRRFDDFLEGIAKDPLAPQLLHYSLIPEPDYAPLRGNFTKELIGCADRGMIDRTALVRALYSDLLRNGGGNARRVHALLTLSPAEHAMVAEQRTVMLHAILGRIARDNMNRNRLLDSLADLRALAPTAAELAATDVRDLLGYLDHSTPVAGYAHEALITIADGGLLDPELLTEMSERTLSRPEKKLVRGQLGLLDRTLRRDSTRADTLLPKIALALGHRDEALQERALTVLARHLTSASDDSVLSALRAAAEQVAPSLAARAAELLGVSTTPSTGPTPETLPPIPEPRPVPGPLATPVEVAQEIAVALADDTDIVAFERALDGLVRHAHLDRPALAAALQPVVRREPRRIVDSVALYDVARALRGDGPRTKQDFETTFGSPPVNMLRARITEVLHLIGTGAEAGSQPFLLAVPTDSTGAVAPAVLAERIAALEERGITPAPIDLAQALLRVRPTPDDAQALAAADRLTSPAGRRLSRWLRDNGLPQHQDTRPTAGSPDRKVRLVRPEATLPDDLELPREAVALVTRPANPGGSPLGPRPYWLAQLPHHREQAILSENVVRYVRQHKWAHILPFLAEAGGPAGYAVHHLLACGMTETKTQDRDRAVDALLVLAARGDLNPGLLAEILAGFLTKSDLYRYGPYTRPNRVHDCLRDAADTGAHATVWSVLRAFLPGILGDTPLRGAGPFLSLAATCAAACRAKGDIPEVVALAERSGSTQLTKNARLLRDVLR